MSEELQTVEEETMEAISVDQSAGLTADTIKYISDVKDDPDWVREYRLRALDVFESKPMPTNWATEDLNNIDFDKIRYYLADGQKPKRSWDEVPAEKRLILP